MIASTMSEYPWYMSNIESFLVGNPPNPLFCLPLECHHTISETGLRLVLCIQLPLLLIGQLRGILVVQGLFHGEADQQSDALRRGEAPGEAPLKGGSDPRIVAES